MQENLNSKLRSDFRVHCCTSFVELVEKGLILEKGLIDKGELKVPYRNPPVQNTPNDRNKFWSQKKMLPMMGLLMLKPYK